VKLQLAPTVRAPFPDELPRNSSAHARLTELANANIVEGFLIKENKKGELPFNFYAEININNSRLWSLFLALSEQLPELVSCIYNFYDNDTKFGKYLPKETVITTLSKFELELVQDCNLEFGLIFHDNDSLIEIFIVESKYVQFWGKDEHRFIEVMKSFDLQHVLDINFIDEFPKVVEPLTKFNDNARDTGQVISAFDEYFCQDNN
jgi:hypothetical protein